MNQIDQSPIGHIPDGRLESELIRVVLADSQGIYSIGIRKVLALESDIRLVAEAGSLEELVIALQQHPANVVLVEGELLIDAPGSISTLQAISPGTKIIVYAASINEEQTVELYRRGIRGIISRSISPDLLVKCIRRIDSGEAWIDNQSLNWVISAYRSQGAETRGPRSKHHLSLKETVIITCITQGMRNKQIASQLGTTEQVIKNYLRKIYDKLGVTDRLELAIQSVQKKIVQADASEVAISQGARQKA
jgi:DNA-binding NarL/FixJ family response regulator